VATNGAASTFHVTPASVRTASSHPSFACVLLCYSQESRHPGTGTYTGLQETDDYIDDAMESYEASLDYPEA
jgi:hypothetical protein